MRVLITGHHGYIGSVTVPALQDAGHEVIGLDTFFYEGCDLRSGREVPALRLDLRDVQPKHLDGLDAIVHLAALSNDPLGALNPQLTSRINYRGTVDLALAAKRAGVSRFIFASSCSMYGAAAADTAVDEDAPLRPVTAYAESKVRSEEALARLADDSFCPVSMRNATAYGVSPRLRVDVVLNNLVGWAFTTAKVRILSDGTPWRPLVHVQDIAAATLALLQAPNELVRGQAFNIGSNDENYQVRQLAQIVQEAVSDCEIEYAGSGDPDPRSYRVDFGRFSRAFPGFSFIWSAERGAGELREAYERVGLTFEEFEGDRYTRLRRLQRLRTRGAVDDELRWCRAPA